MVILIPFLQISMINPSRNYESPVFQIKIHQVPTILSSKKLEASKMIMGKLLLSLVNTSMT